jgi:intracellular septation protein
VLLGGATLVLQDEAFIKWKPTVLYWLFAVVLFLSNLFFKKNLIKALLEKQMALPIAVWDKLNMSWIVFFIVMGGLNIHIGFNFSIDTWVNFKLFGSVGLMLVFVVIQAIILGKYMKDPEDREIVTAPENGYPMESATIQERISQRKGDGV